MGHRIILFIVFCHALAYAQSKEDESNLGLFIDSDYIDQAYIRQEIQYVHYVRIRQEADVHILITTQNTGGQGTEYEILFVGQNRFPGINDTLTFVAGQTDTEEMVRKEMIHTIRLGLMRYVEKLPVSRYLSISYEPPRGGELEKKDDKWNNWVFSIQMNSHMDGEKSAKSVNLGGALKVMRVTEKWKILFSVNTNYDEKRYDVENVKSFSISRDRGSELDMVRAIDDHWSFGAWATYFSSTYSNIEYRFFVEPKLEYNVFPYSISTRQQFRISYGIRPRYQKYYEETIYLKHAEMLYEESLDLNLEMVKTWGTIEFGVNASHYLHDFHKNSLNLNGELSLKLFKGLSLNLHGGLTMQRNQLALPKRDATTEEVLLQRRELESQYSYFSLVGLTYSFGALYNDIVNPRFGNWW